MFQVGIVAHFEAAHRLRGNFGPASNPHGHTYRIEITVAGASLHDDGTLFDIGMLQEAAQNAISGLHYHDLDQVTGFEGRNTTAEVVAQYLFDQIAPHLGNRDLASMEVRVWESPQAFAGYAGSL